MNRCARTTLVALAAALVLASCSSSDEADESESSALDCQTDEATQPEGEMPATDDVAAAVEERGKPEVNVPTEPVTELGIVDMIEGQGEPVEEGAEVTVHYVGVQQATCDEFDTSWGRGPATFSLDGVIAGWTEGIVGMKPGGRRELTIPSDMAYGDDETSGRPTGTLVFIVDLIPGLEADPDALQAAEERGEPDVAAPDPLPTEVATVDEVKGSGPELSEASTALLLYKGVDGSGEVFDSTWPANDPAEFPLGSVIPGFATGLEGMKVGGRRTIVIPPDQAYGETPPEGAPTGTLTFVVDLVGAG